MVSKSFWALSLVLALFPLGAGAGMAPAGPWRTGLMSDPEGKFQYCLSEARFAGKTSLIIALNPLAQVNIGLGLAEAGLTPGAEQSFTLSIDRRFEKTLQAKVMKPDLMVVSGGVDPALLAALANGSVLTLTGAKTYSFNLKGSAAMVATLKQCVETNSGLTLPTAAPVATAAAEPPPAASEPQSVLPATTTPLVVTAPPAIVAEPEVAAALPAPVAGPALPLPLQQLLVRAGLRDLSPAALAAAPEAADFAWRAADGIIGGVKESRLPAGTKLAPVVAARRAALQTACKAAFTAAPTSPMATATLEADVLYTTCGQTEQATVFVLSAEGVLSVLTQQGPANVLKAVSANLLRVLTGAKG